MILGRIKCYFEARGYGFIEDNDGREVYFHLSVVEGVQTGTIRDGASVYFDVISTGIGLEAFKVRVMG